MNTCKFCEIEILEERRLAGYDYCLSDTCVKQGLAKTPVVRVSVNKSNDVFEIYRPKTVLETTRYLFDDTEEVVERKIQKVARKEVSTKPSIFELRSRVLKTLSELDKQYESGLEVDELLRRKSRVVTTWNKYIKNGNIRYSSWLLYPGTELDKS
jgi:hypothetical protein